MGNVHSNLTPVTGEEVAQLVVGPIEKYALRCTMTPLCIDLLLLGCYVLQVNSYFTYQSNDSRLTKSVVIVVLMINLIFSAYHINFVSWIFVENFGKLAPFLNPQRIAWTPFLESLTTSIVQAFMAWRAYKLLGSKQIWLIIPISIWILSIVNIGAASATTYITYGLHSLIDANRVAASQLTWLATIMISDLVITISMLYGLYRSKTGWGETDKIVTKLLRMTVESQMPPFVIAIMMMVCYALVLTGSVREPRDYLQVTLANSQSKFYAVGMMYSLNARIAIHRDLSKMTSNDQNGFAMSNRGTRQPTQIHVNIDEETYISGPYQQTGPLQDRKEDDSSSMDGDGKGNTLDYGSQARLTDENPAPRTRFA